MFAIPDGGGRFYAKFCSGMSGAVAGNAGGSLVLGRLPAAGGMRKQPRLNVAPGFSVAGVRAGTAPLHRFTPLVLDGRKFRVRIQALHELPVGGGDNLPAVHPDEVRLREPMQQHVALQLLEVEVFEQVGLAERSRAAELPEDSRRLYPERLAHRVQGKSQSMPRIARHADDHPPQCMPIEIVAECDGLVGCDIPATG